ncbi:MAG: molybdopterin cofactor-binding domain-containing protein [Pseudomonadota bacterium]
MARLSRRTLIIGGLVGGAVAIGYVAVPGRPEWNGPLNDGDVLFNNWVKIAPDGTVTAFIAQAEMGQGVQSGFAAVLAEEMGADWSRMAVEQAPNHPSYSNIMFASGIVTGSLPEFMKPAGVWAVKEVLSRVGLIATGGSSSMRDKYLRLREAGALARMTLQQAAADLWDVPFGECTVRNSTVIHTPSSKRLDFADLVEQAAVTKVKQDVYLKPDANFNIIGREGRKRLDLPQKVDGTAGFGADVRVPGMVYAAIKNGGSSLGDIIAVDKATALAEPGVIDVIETRDWVAVVGKTYWHAQMAADLLTIERNQRVGAPMVNNWQEKRVEASSKSGDGAFILHDDDGVETQFADAADIVQATYSVPYLAHACLETNVATASVTDAKVEVWAPTQSSTILASSVAGALEVEGDIVEVHTTLLGGGFGRKVEPDAAIQAAMISRAVGKPVQVIWSREEDFHSDVFRPAAAGTLTAALGAGGDVRAIKAHVASQSVGTSFQSRWFGASGDFEGNDPTTVEGLEELPYDVGAYRLGYSDHVAPANIGYWRSVGHSYTAFFAEAFADEVAERLGEDPLDYRLKRMKDPRGTAALEAVATASGYRNGPPRGRYQGVAYHHSYETHVAMIMEIAPSLDDDLPKVTRVFASVDVGTPIDPDTIRAQIEGSIAFGLSAALYGNITFDAGVPQLSNFDGYRLLSLAEMPEVQVDVLASDGPIGGVGEPGVPPVGPALANAVYQWSGQRVRQLPLADFPPSRIAADKIASTGTF